MCLLEAARGGKVWFCAPTFAQAKELFFDPFLAMVREGGGTSLLAGDPNRTELSIRFRSGGIIWAKSTDRPEGLAGRGLTLICADEAQDMPSTILDEQFGPLVAGTPNKRLGKILFTGTPRGIGNWLFDLYQRGQSLPGWRSWLMDVYSANMIPRSEIEASRAAAEARGSVALKLWKREYMADFQSFVGAVFDFWDPAKHVVEPPSVFDETIFGVDWGFSETHPGVVEVLGRVGDRWYVIDEVSQVKQTLAGFWVPQLKRLIDKWAPSIIFCDPSQPGSIQTLRDSLSVTVRPAKNDVDSGLAILSSAVELGELLLTPRCPELIKKLPAYQWEKDRATGHFKETPKKIWDDEIDALRYAFATYHLTGKVRGA